MQKRILITGRLPSEAMNLIPREYYVEMNLKDKPFDRQRLLQSIKDKDGFISMITDSVDAELLDRAHHLKMIAHFGVGYNNIDIHAATMRGIMVSNTPDVLTVATADLTFALILAVARRIIEMDRVTRKGLFRHWAPMLFLGNDVSGKTLGIIGLGRIGRAVALRAKGFNMSILYYNRRRIDTEEEKKLGVKYVDFKTLLSRSDYISLHVPLTEHTRHLIGKEELALMKSTAFLINTSRGSVIDEGALVDALQNKKIGGAGLDVYEHEPEITPGLVHCDNVVLLPHVGSGTIETRIRMATTAIENLVTGLRGGIPPHLVNPEVLTHRRAVDKKQEVIFRNGGLCNKDKKGEN